MAYVTIQVESEAREQLRVAQNVAAGLVPDQPRPTMSAVLTAALAVARQHPEQFADELRVGS